MIRVTPYTHTFSRCEHHHYAVIAEGVMVSEIDRKKAQRFERELAHREGNDHPGKGHRVRPQSLPG